MSAPIVIDPEATETEPIGPDYARVLAMQEKEEALEQMRVGATADQDPIDIPALRGQDEVDDEADSISFKEVLAGKLPDPGEVAREVLGSSPGEVARTVGKGIVKGITESPEAFLNGVAEAIFADLFVFTNDIEDALEGTPFERQESVFADISRIATEDFFTGLQENEETTFIGNMIREMTNYAVYFIPIAKGLKATNVAIAAAKVAPKTTRAVRLTASGALADLIAVDPHDEDLRALVEAYPSLQGGVVEAFAGDPSDSNWDKRMRAAFLGAGLGASTDLFIGALKASRGLVRAQIRARRARKRADSLPGTAEAGEVELKGPFVTPEEASISGFKEGEGLVRPSVSRAEAKIRKSEEELAQRFPNLTPAELRERAEATTSSIDINVDRITKEEDVRQLLKDTTALFESDIMRGKRGVITNEKTIEQSKKLGFGIIEVLSRNQGVALNAAQINAYREVWVSSMRVTTELGRIAIQTGSAVDNYKFRKSISVFNAINESVQGARAESGRSLQAWNIEAVGNAERAEMMKTLVTATGGNRTTRLLAESLINAVEAGHGPGKINELARRGALSKTIDAVKESVIIGLLWNLSTHAANAGTNSLRLAVAPAERAVSARLSSFTETPGGVEVGEATAMMHGMIRAIKALAANGADAEALKEATAQSVAQTGRKLDIRVNSMSAKAAGLDPNGAMGKAVEFVGNQLTRPARYLQKADDLYKAVGFAGETGAQAHRQAVVEGRKKGWSLEQISKRMQDLENDPPEHIRLASGNAALYNTFTQNPGSVAELMFKVRDTVPGSFFYFPFIKTPMNVMRYNFEFSPLAPLVGQAKRDFMNGGANANIVAARMAMGSVMSLYFADLAMEGVLQGPLSSKPGVRDAQLRMNVQPSSLNIGGHTFSINRLDPLGPNAAVTGAIVEMLATHQFEEEDFPEISEIMAGSVISFADAMRERTTFVGFSDIVSLVRDPENRGPRELQKKIQMLIPASSLVKTINALAEPERPDVSTAAGAVMAMVDGLEQRLPRARNVHGHILERPRIDAVNPFKVKEFKPTPFEQAIVKDNINYTRIQRRTSFDGAEVNFRNFPNVYEAFVIETGHKAKIDGLGLEETLNRLVQTREYQLMSGSPDGGRAWEITRRRRIWKKIATHNIMFDPRQEYQTEEFERFREMVREKKRLKIERLIPSLENLE